MTVPWLVIAGNHDHYGNVTAEIAYSADNSRWVYPSLYHSKSFVSEDGVTVDVILIDTIDLAGEINIPVSSSCVFYSTHHSMNSICEF